MPPSPAGPATRQEALPLQSIARSQRNRNPPLPPHPASPPSPRPPPGGGGTPTARGRGVEEAPPDPRRQSGPPVSAPSRSDEGGPCGAKGYVPRVSTEFGWWASITEWPLGRSMNLFGISPSFCGGQVLGSEVAVRVSPPPLRPCPQENMSFGAVVKAFHVFTGRAQKGPTTTARTTVLISVFRIWWRLFRSQRATQTCQRESSEASSSFSKAFAPSKVALSRRTSFAQATAPAGTPQTRPRGRSSASARV